MRFLIKICIFAMFVGVLAIADEDFNKLVAKADIFYYSPDPNSKGPITRLENLQTFNGTGEIKIIVHGYIASKDHPSIVPVRNAYLSIGMNSVFMADWSDAAKILYPQSRFLVQPIGLRFAKLLDAFLKKFNLDPANVHILGHSLGAHVAGNMGLYFKGSIGRITGLDPALPLFEKFSRDNLRANTAQFVDIIHTDAQVLGDFTPRGHADFYPNNGFVPQPGCATLDIVTITACSHYRAPIFYAESIVVMNNFPSVKCKLETIRRKQGKLCLNSLNAETVLMGESVSRRARGLYFLETNNVPPYGLGVFSKGVVNTSTSVSR